MRIRTWSCQKHKGRPLKLGHSFPTQLHKTQDLVNQISYNITCACYVCKFCFQRWAVYICLCWNKCHVMFCSVHNWQTNLEKWFPCATINLIHVIHISSRTHQVICLKVSRFCFQNCRLIYFLKIIEILCIWKLGGVLKMLSEAAFVV